MMDRYFISDLHLGHKAQIKWRGFKSQEEHDTAVIESLMTLPKKSKLWVLGDIAFNEESLKLINRIPSRLKVCVLGNHDKMPAKKYLEVFNDIIAPIKYKRFWLSHQPIHLQEMYRVRGNIHGHIHDNAATKPLQYPYFNVNWDFHKQPVLFERIEEFFEYNEQDFS